MKTKKRAVERSERGVKISDFRIPEPDFNKSLEEYPERKKAIDTYLAQSELDKRITKEVLDIEFEI